MHFDQDEYREEFLKKHRATRSAPGDLLARYAITLPASDREIAAQLKAVRSYWNTIYTGSSSIARVAKLCRTEDERLRAKHGPKMDTPSWWQQQQSEQQKSADASITIMSDELQRRYGKLGVVPSGMLSHFAENLGLTTAQANQAAERCGLTVIANVTLPETEPISTFKGLLTAMSECAVPSVPELVHPGSGPFRLVDRYECLADPRKRLDAVAVDAQSAEADKQRKSATVDARRAALTVLRKAVRDGVELREIALYHLVTVARDAASVSADIAAAKLREAGVEARDAAIIAVLVAEQGTSGGTRPQRVPDLLAAGRLREARAALASLSSDDSGRADAEQRIAAAQHRLDELVAAARAATTAHDEARAQALLKEASLISAEDADEKLAEVPLPPPVSLHATGEGTGVSLFWRPAPGHDPETIYLVRRSTPARPLSTPDDGEPVSRDRGNTCSDPRVPVARPVQYAVFATTDGRPPSRRATVSMTLLPPVTQLKAEVGPATVALSWSAHPDARVEVTRTAPGTVPVPVRVTGGGCQVSGLTEGQRQHFEVTAVYTGPDGTELRSVPTGISATPRAEARPVTTLRARVVGTEGAIRVQVTWRQVDNSDVRIVRCAREPAVPLGTLVPAEEMTAIGDEMTGTLLATGETGFETELPPGVHRLVPFSIGGTGIVIGKPVTVAVTDPVRHLSVTPFADYATVSWEWPPGAQVAEVSWRVDGTEDVMHVDVGQYRSAGGFKIPLGRGRCEVEVRAVITVGKTSFTSPPVTATVAQVVETPIRYDVATLAPTLRGRLKKVSFSAEQTCAGVRVQMVASPARVMPRGPSDGETVLDTALTLQPGVPGEYKVTVPRKTIWVRCFVITGQARLIDPPINRLKE